MENSRSFRFVDVLKFLPTLLVTAMIVGIWVEDFFIFVFVALVWLGVPIIIAAIFFWVKSFKRRNVQDKVMMVWGFVNVLLIAVPEVWNLCTPPEPERMAQYYDRHADELHELVSYTRGAMDDSTYLHLEFEHGKASMFHLKTKGDDHISHHWDDAHSKRDSLMAVVGLCQEEYAEIRRRLRKVHCIGITCSNGIEDPNTAVVDYYREWMGMYSFLLFDRPITDEEHERFMENGMTIPYTERVVLQYSGGAIGPQTFPQEAKERFMRERGLLHDDGSPDDMKE